MVVRPWRMPTRGGLRATGAGGRRWRSRPPRGTGRCYAPLISRPFAISLGLLAALGCGSPDASSARPPPRAPVEAPPLADSARSCTEAHECWLVHRGCCPLCTVPELDDVSAVLGAERDAFRAAECPDRGACPACEAPTNEHLFATCVDGTCVGVDVRAHALSECTSDDECVATGRDCCRCDPRFVAVRADQRAAYYRAQCGETPVCSPCSPDEAPNPWLARCVAGHCALHAASPLALRLELLHPTMRAGGDPDRDVAARLDARLLVRSNVDRTISTRTYASFELDWSIVGGDGSRWEVTFLPPPMPRPGGVPPRTVALMGGAEGVLADLHGVSGYRRVGDASNAWHRVLPAGRYEVSVGGVRLEDGAVLSASPAVLVVLP